MIILCFGLAARKLVFWRNSGKVETTNFKTEDHHEINNISTWKNCGQQWEFWLLEHLKEISCTQSVRPLPPYQSLFLSVSDHWWHLTWRSPHLHQLHSGNSWLLHLKLNGPFILHLSEKVSPFLCSSLEPPNHFLRDLGDVRVTSQPRPLGCGPVSS